VAHIIPIGARREARREADAKMDTIWMLFMSGEGLNDCHFPVHGLTCDVLGWKLVRPNHFYLVPVVVTNLLRKLSPLTGFLTTPNTDASHFPCPAEVDSGILDKLDWPRTTSSGAKKKDNGQLPLLHPSIYWLADKNHRVCIYAKYFFILAQKPEQICAAHQTMQNA
jgi:hypothetical protein